MTMQFIELGPLSLSYSDGQVGIHGKHALAPDDVVYVAVGHLPILISALVEAHARPREKTADRESLKDIVAQ